MAVINGIYVHVTSENVSREVVLTSHPVESGLPITDTVRPDAISIALSGKIVDYGETKASDVLVKLKSWQASGALIDYRGRNVASNMQIRNFETSHVSTNSGGADFTMELAQVRIAKSAYVPKKATSTAQKQEAKNDSAKFKVGATVIFKGGGVYVSSDAAKPAATRNRSTCKITKVSTETWSKHQYHVESTDGGNVYGWVDLANLENAEQTTTNGKTNAGTQQVKQGSKKAVYHKVKKGDTVWALCNKKYKYLGKSCSWVINNNPSAFSRKGDATTLQIGKSLKMGYK